MLRLTRRRLLQVLVQSGIVSWLLARSDAFRSAHAAAPRPHVDVDASARRAVVPLASIDVDSALEITASVEARAVLPGPVSDVWQYDVRQSGDALPNPLLRVRRGQTLDATLVNRLGDDTTVHWHGLVVDEANDGSGLHPVRHGERYRYRFEVRNRSALYWYHAHPHSRTGEQVHQGLAGLLLVEDEDELALRNALGLKWGDTDLALMLADKQFGRKNSLKYKVGADDWIGNHVLVNWVPEPFLEVVPRGYRLRLANVSNARVFKLVFRGARGPLSYFLLGTDGGLLERPQKVDQLYLAPAQRVDLFLDLSKQPADSVVALQSADYDPMENDGGLQPEDPMMEHPGATPMGGPLDILELRVRQGESAPVKLPTRLSTLPSIDLRGAATRRFKLWINDKGRWLINDWNFHLNGHEPVFSVSRGSREIWEFTNTMRSMPHPIHAHGFSFRVLSRADSPRQIRTLATASAGRTPHDLGLLDTVLVWPGERVRIALDFSQPYNGRQVYMLHCHNLEHEDQGMMIAFAVVD